MFFAFFSREPVTQNVDLGPGYFVMLCRKQFKSYRYFLMFYIIKIKPGPKLKFLGMIPSRRMFLKYPYSFKCILQKVNEKFVLKKLKY